MEHKSGRTSEELLQTVTELMEADGGFNVDQPVVLSCGGIHLKGRKLPARLTSWHTHIFLPHPDRAGVRIFRLKGESSEKSLQRLLEMESLN